MQVGYTAVMSLLYLLFIVNKLVLPTGVYSKHDCYPDCISISHIRPGKYDASPIAAAAVDIIIP